MKTTRKTKTAEEIAQAQTLRRIKAKYAARGRRARITRMRTALGYFNWNS